MHNRFFTKLTLKDMLQEEAKKQSKQLTEPPKLKRCDAFNEPVTPLNKSRLNPLYVSESRETEVKSSCRCIIS